MEIYRFYWATIQLNIKQKYFRQNKTIFQSNPKQKQTDTIFEFTRLFGYTPNKSLNSKIRKKKLTCLSLFM